MGLFSTTQMEQINSVAKKSKETLKKSSSNVSAKSINRELNASSRAVMEYFQDSTAILIESKEQLHDYITKCIEYGFVGIDTETTGLDRIHDTVVGASLYAPGLDECYIPMKHIVPIFEEPYKNQLTYEEVGEEFQRFADANTKMIFANADFDLSMIYKDLRVDMNDICYYDVILAWRCLKEDEPKNGLKDLYNKYVLRGKGDPKKFSDFFSPKLFPYCKPQIAKLYAANDAKITYDLFIWQLPYLTKTNKKCQHSHLEHIADLVWNVEFPLMKVCQDMHRIGAYLDSHTAEALNERYSSMQQIESTKLSNMVQEVIENTQFDAALAKKKRPFTSGKDFNPQSPPQVKYLLYDLMKLPQGRDGGSTGKEVLHEFNLPITNQILKVRSLGVLINTFVKKLPNSTTPDSRIHAQFKQVGAACVTGDTIVPTDRGYCRIDEIYKGVSDTNRSGEFIDADVNIYDKDQLIQNANKVIMYENVPTIKITTEFGLTIEGTYNHPIMISKYKFNEKSYIDLRTMWDDRRFQPLSDIKVGDLIEVPCNYSYSTTYQPTNLTLLSGNNYTEKHPKMPEIIDEDFAEFLGMYHADGSSGLREGTYSVTLSNDDPDVFRHFDELAWKLFNVKTSHYSKQIENHEFETYINCYKLRDLSKILISGKRNKKIPSVIWKSPKSVINAYIRGMTLDSTVYYDENNRGSLEISIMNEEDVRLVQMHLISQGIYCYRTMNVPGEKNRFLRLSFNADNYMLFRDNIGFIESKKYIYTVECAKNKYCNRRIGDSIHVKVKDIQYKTNDVYDLHVPTTHSFISNGMISHNTGRFSSADPNLQNVPAHANDIRHLFRATPSMSIEVDCKEVKDDENKITVTLSRYDKVYRHREGDEDEMIVVHDLKINDIIKILDEDNNNVYAKIISIDENKKDISKLDMVLDVSVC